MAQRLVRAKGKIRAAGIPYEVPGSDRLAERLDGVLRVVYLVFNEGYAATSGDALVRRELCARGDPPGPAPARAAARARARWPACSPSCSCRTRGAPRASTRAASWSPSRSRTASLWDRGADRRGAGAGRGGAAPRRRGLLRAAGGDRRPARPGRAGRGHGLAADRGALRAAPAPPSLAGGGAEPRGGGGDGRAARARPAPDRAARGRRASCEAYHLLPAAKADILRRLGPPRGGRRGLRAGARSSSPRTPSGATSSGGCARCARPVAVNIRDPRAEVLMRVFFLLAVLALATEARAQAPLTVGSLTAQPGQKVSGWLEVPDGVRSRDAHPRERGPWDPAGPGARAGGGHPRLRVHVDRGPAAGPRAPGSAADDRLGDPRAHGQPHRLLRTPHLLQPGREEPEPGLSRQGRRHPQRADRLRSSPGRSSTRPPTWPTCIVGTGTSRCAPTRTGR